LLAVGDVDDLALEFTPLRDISQHQQSMRFSADLNRGDDAAGGEETAVAMHAVHVARKEFGLGEPLIDLARDLLVLTFGVAREYAATLPDEAPRLVPGHTCDGAVRHADRARGIDHQHAFAHRIENAGLDLQRLFPAAPHGHFRAGHGEARGLTLMHHETDTVLEPAHLAIDEM